MKWAVGLCFAGLLIGCASTGSSIHTALAPAIESGVTEADCDTTCSEQWQRAQLWLAKHSKWKIQTATDAIIQTFNPTGYDPSYGFSVTKEPLGGGRYRITMELACGNPFGCSPKSEDVRAAFYYYVQTGNDLLAGIGNLGGGIR